MVDSGERRRVSMLRAATIVVIAIIAVVAVAIGADPCHAQEFPARLERTFVYDVTVDHDEGKDITQEFCLPAIYVVWDHHVVEKSRNGEYTALRSITIPPERPNCIR